MEAGPRSVRVRGRDDAALGVHRPGMAPGAVREGGGRMTWAGRESVAGPAERLRGTARPDRCAQLELRVVREIRSVAVAVHPGAGEGVRIEPGRRAVGARGTRQVDLGGKEIVEVARAPDLCRDLVAGTARHGRGDEGLADDVRLVRANPGRRRVGVAGYVPRRRRRLSAAVARRASRGAIGRDLKDVAGLAGNPCLGAREIGAMAALAEGEVPVLRGHEVHVELGIVRIQDPALVDAGAGVRHPAVHDPRARLVEGGGHRLVHGVGLGRVDDIPERRAGLARHGHRRARRAERLEVRGGPVPGLRTRTGVAGVALRRVQWSDVLHPAHRVGRVALLLARVRAGGCGERGGENALDFVHASSQGALIVCTVAIAAIRFGPWQTRHCSPCVFAGTELRGTQNCPPLVCMWSMADVPSWQAEHAAMMGVVTRLAGLPWVATPVRALKEKPVPYTPGGAWGEVPAAGGVATVPVVVVLTSMFGRAACASG